MIIPYSVGQNYLKHHCHTICMATLFKWKLLCRDWPNRRIDQFSKTETIKLLNLFILAHQLGTTSGLRVLDSGHGFPVYGAADKIVDYAVLGADHKATPPSQVIWSFELVFSFELFTFSVDNLLVCDCRCCVNRLQLLPISPSVCLPTLLLLINTWLSGANFVTVKICICAI